MSATTVKCISLTQYKASKNVTKLDIFTSRKTSKKYAVLPNGDFAGMLSEDCDLNKPVVVFTMRDETGETWDFFANGEERVAEASI